MIPKADPSLRAAGVDVGTSLTKLALRDGDELSLRVLPSHAIERAASEIESFCPARIGLTGTGAAQLAAHMGLDTSPIVEFEAWRAGVAVLLARQGAAPIGRDLIVSLGTGTSFLLAEPDSVARVGGTALGGGTLDALGRALVGANDPEALIALAEAGNRREVDLTLSDVDPEGALALSGDFTAAFLAKLGSTTVEPADTAHALIGMVAESAGILASAMAAALQAGRILYGGGLLRGNRPLREILAAYTFAGEKLFLEDGEFAGALGALEHVLEAPTARR